MKSLKISLPKNQIDLLIIIDLVLIYLSLWLLQTTNIDLDIQKHLFISDGKHWLIDRTDPIKKFIFYNFPKVLFGLAAAYCLVCAVLGFRKKSSEKFYKNRHRFTLIFISLILIPLSVGNIKKFTNVYCPAQLEIYDGDKPYAKIFDSYPADFHSNKKGLCFPAGHCVTGFAFMILFFALRKKAQQIFSLLSSITLGWILGWYQMAKGVHFFGDTLISMLVCFLLAALIARIYSKFQEYD